MKLFSRNSPPPRVFHSRKRGDWFGGRKRWSTAEAKAAAAGVARVPSTWNLRAEYDFFGTRPGGKLFPSGGHRCFPMLHRYMYILYMYIYRIPKSLLPFLRFDCEGVTYDNCREQNPRLPLQVAFTFTVIGFRHLTRLIKLFPLMETYLRSPLRSG